MKFCITPCITNYYTIDPLVLAPLILTHFFLKKIFFLPEPQHKAEKHRNKAEIFLNFLLTFISLFSLIIYLVKSSTNNERHVFLTYMSTRVSNLTTYICFIIVLIYYHGFTIIIMVQTMLTRFQHFNLSMFTEEDGPYR